ncbi:hypothetical protein RB595_003366 [Gaeumannomyces hyphopodioides]
MNVLFESPRTVFFGRSEVHQQVQAMPPPLPFEEEEEVPPVFIQSDIGLQNRVAAANNDASEDEAELIGPSAPSPVENGGGEDEDDEDEDEDEDDGDIVNEISPAHVPDEDVDNNASPAPAPTTNGRKRGRPSLSAAGSRNSTPAKTPSRSTLAKTPRTGKSSVASKATPSTTGAKRGRKRKADDGDASGAAPAAKKSRAPRTIREEREPTRAVSKRSAAAAAKETFATALNVKITKVEVPATTGKRRGRKPAAAAAKADQDWEVEEIIDAGVIGPNGKPKTYLVKWKGYSADENTWEPRKNLAGCPELLKAFDAQNQPEKASTKKAPGRKPGAKAGRKAAAEKPAPAVGPPEKKEPRKAPTERKLAVPKKPTKSTGRRGRPAARK